MLQSPYPESIYIHLPFCKTKCPYCDFASFTERGSDIKKNYLEALNREISNFFECQYESSPNHKPINIKTIFFGGGTPSIHSAEEIATIIKQIKNYCSFDDEIEITLEANPGTVDRNKLEEFKAVGINRISIGAQTFKQKLLDKLARGHRVDDCYKIIEDIKNTKFKSWSFDLIYGLPKQNLNDWIESLDIALSFASPHISAYALSIETGTAFGDIYKNSEHQDLAQEEELSEMYQACDEKLSQAGLYRYEISNWAKPDHQCKHNLCYWRAEEYFAFGLSAHGYYQNYRFAHSRNLNEYINLFLNKSAEELKAAIKKRNIYFSTEFISKEESIEEEILLKLRLSEGLDLREEILERLNTESLNRLLDTKYLKKTEDRLYLENKAYFLSNSVISDLIR